MNKICMLGLLLTSSSLLADGTLTSSATATVAVSESIGIGTGLSSISLTGVDVLDETVTSGTGTFVVIANAPTTVYDVWLSVPADNLDASNDVYKALNGTNAIPLTVSLIGNSGSNSVSANPAAMQTGAPSTAQPSTGSKSDGDGVAGTNRGAGTTYTVTLSENTALDSIYSNIPAGSYTVTITANIAHGD